VSLLLSLSLSLAQDQEEDQEELLVGGIFQPLVCYGTTDALIHSIHSLHYQWQPAVCPAVVPAEVLPDGLQLTSLAVAVT